VGALIAAAFVCAQQKKRDGEQEAVSENVMTSAGDVVRAVLL